MIPTELVAEPRSEVQLWIDSPTLLTTQPSGGPCEKLEITKHRETSEERVLLGDPINAMYRKVKSLTLSICYYLPVEGRKGGSTPERKFSLQLHGLLML